MSDLAISFGLLNQASNDITNLGPEIKRIEATTTPTATRVSIPLVPGEVNRNDNEIGPGLTLYRALGDFYTKWQTPASDAMDGLKKLGGYFKQVADAFEEMDASTAGGLNEGQVISQVLSYPQEMDQYNNALEWEWTRDSNGKMIQRYADPTPPVMPQSPFSLTDGVTTSYTLDGVQDPFSPPGVKASSWPNYLVNSETTTVTEDGMTYTETTNFGPDKGWGPDGPTQDTSQIITNPDGSTDIITTKVDQVFGGGIRTDLSSSNNQTTTYTRPNWESSWVDQTPAGNTQNPANPKNHPTPIPPR